MCGIFVCISRGEASVKQHADNDILQKLKQRGPDHCATHRLDIAAPNTRPHDDLTLSKVSLSATCTVLALRGQRVVSQPLCDDESQSFLCWSGEAWGLGDQTVVGNDTQAVFNSLLRAIRLVDSTALNDSPDLCQDKIVNALMDITGPFAFVFFDGYSSKLYFGRDCIGRRSLLMKCDESGFQLSSVSDGSEHWTEVEAEGVHCLDLSLLATLNDSDSNHFTSNDISKSVKCSPYASFGKYATFNDNCLEGSGQVGVREKSIEVLHEILFKSTRTRSERIFIPALHVGAEDDLSPPSRYRPKVAVLFSGGLDCTLIARLLHHTLPQGEEVDLLNVAFENPRLKHGESAYSLCPDRITAQASCAELQSTCPDRVWRLVEINIPYKTAMQHRSIVVSLMAPHNTEMDLSIAFALYFASRGIGMCFDADGTNKPYETPARVLFSGLGADELFGGYQRHKTAFDRQGLDGLSAELKLDIGRLGKRNLGRDDRVISHWSKEARYPFLDEEVVRWAVEAPINVKTGFGEHTPTDSVESTAHSIEPGKKALRLLAIKLGMHKVALEKKRAIQFGARTAKLEGRTKGTDLIT